MQRDGCLIYFLGMPSGQSTSAPSESWLSAPSVSWLESDLLFLGLSLQNRMPMAEIAGFLARNEDEVREKARELRRDE